MAAQSAATALRAAVAPSRPAERPTTIQGMLTVYKDQIAAALPRHMDPDRMARVALTACRTTPALLKCNPASLFGAIIQCSQLGLEPGGALGHAYLVPFKNDVQFIIGYRGMIDLARRSGQIVTLQANAVYEGDEFTVRYGLDPTLTHTPNFDNPERAQAKHLRYVYAVAKLKDGGTQFAVMSRAEVEAIRLRSKAGSSGPWVTDYEAMALKTVTRRLFKWLPVSIEMQRAVGLDEIAETDQSQNNALVLEGLTDAPLELAHEAPEGEAAEASAGAPAAAQRGAA